MTQMQGTRCKELVDFKLLPIWSYCDISIEHFSHKVIINYTKGKIVQNNNYNNNDIDIHATTVGEPSVNVSSEVKILHDY